MDNTPWLNPEELAAWKSLSLMQLQIGAELNRSLAAGGLSYSDYLVLASLSDAPDGRRRVLDLGRELGWEKSRASHHVARMCRRELVRKVPCPDDQRGFFVEITKNGHDVIRLHAPAHVAQVRDLFFQHVTSTELQTLTRVASRVLAALPASAPDVTSLHPRH